MNTVISLSEYPEICKFCKWFKREHKERGLDWINITVENRTFRITPKEVQQLVVFLSLGTHNEVLSLIEEDLREVNLVESRIQQGPAQTFYFDEYS